MCTPYIFGYEFQAMVGTREDANKPYRINYSIILPQGPVQGLLLFQFIFILQFNPPPQKKNLI